MTTARLVSYAQNGEDVVLWRALSHVREGVYVDIGGWDPDVDSVTRLFYERGWRGIDVEPVPEFADKFRARRPMNEVVEAAVTDVEVDGVVFHRVGATGLSTMDDQLAAQHTASGLDTEELRVRAKRLDAILASSALVQHGVHFLKVDVEGAEAQVLRSVDLSVWRPWVLVIEATLPNSTTTTHGQWEQLVLDAGYTFTLFDGLSRYYVSPEHPELADALSYPACALDDFVLREQVELEEQVAALQETGRLSTEAALHWRNTAVSFWADAMAASQAKDVAAAGARLESERMAEQLTTARSRLEKVRGERDRARQRAEKLGARSRLMSQQIKDLETTPPAGQSHDSTLGRLRRALGRSDA